MEAFTRYILISTFCLSILYLAYLVFQKKETRLLQLRYFLIFSIILSLILPLSTYRIDLKLTHYENEIEEIHQSPATETALDDDRSALNHLDNSPNKKTDWSIVNLLFIVYFMGVAFFGLHLLVHLTRILYLFWSSNRVRHDNIVLLNCDTSSPFTFFNWIFIPNYLEKDESKEIITHERIHASQYHSIDLILIELLAAVMWFNPLVWMMKNSVQLVHEYLADEGVLNTGTNKLRYQALLINQVAEERLICLSSSFNHSLIKKRIIMMTKSKFNQGSKLRILALIPLTALLFFAVSVVNGQNQPSYIGNETISSDIPLATFKGVKIGSNSFKRPEISKQQLLKSDGLEVTNLKGFNVTYFEIMYYSDKYGDIIFGVPNNKYPDNVKEFINDLKSGDRIFISRISCQKENGEKKMAPPFSIQIN